MLNGPTFSTPKQEGITQEVLNQVLSQLWKSYQLTDQQSLEQQVGLFYKSLYIEVKLNNFTSLLKLNPSQGKAFLSGPTKTQEMVQYFLQPAVKHLERVVGRQHMDITEIHTVLFSYLISYQSFMKNLMIAFQMSKMSLIWD